MDFTPFLSFPMTRAHIMRVLLFCAVFAVPLHAQTSIGSPSAEREFFQAREAADSRDLPRVLSFLGRSDALDAEVLLLLGSMQPEGETDRMLGFLASKNDRVRSAAAFALAQSLRGGKPKPRIDSAWFAAIDTETVAQHKAALISLLGFFGGREALLRIAALIADPGSRDADLLREAKARGIARFAVRGIKAPEATRAAGELLRRSDGKGRVAAAAALTLGAIADSTLLLPFIDAIRDAAGSPDPDVRVAAVTALGKIRTAEAGSAIVRAAGDRDPRVRIAALRGIPALQRTKGLGKDVLRILIEGMRSSAYAVVKTALQSTARLERPDMRLTLAVTKLRDTSRSEDLRDEALRTLAHTAPDLALAAVQSEKRGSEPRPIAFEALAILATNENRPFPEFQPWLIEHLLMPHGPRAAAAASALGTLWRISVRSRTDPDTAEDARFRAAFHSALKLHSSPGLLNSGAVQNAVEALRDSAVASASSAPVLLEALHQFSSMSNVETAIVLLEAVAALGDTVHWRSLGRYAHDPNGAVRRIAGEAMERAGLRLPAMRPPLPPPHPRDPDILRSIREQPTVRMRTRRGAITIRLFPDEAPFTVEAFVRLARQGFYNGLTFHRVVPNFVTQGGDPAGDGTGGPPFTLRSEFSMRSFSRGRVGMASAGKDTEGSQFFFMLSDVAHLDGRYTCFGEVVEGMSAVDALEIGDTILGIEFAAK